MQPALEIASPFREPDLSELFFALGVVCDAGLDVGKGGVGVCNEGLGGGWRGG